MALDRLVEEIRARAVQELAAEQARTAAEERQIAEEAERRAAEIREDAQRRAEAEASREVAQKVAGAKLQARKLVYAAREQRTAAQLAELRELLGEFTDSTEYPKVLKRMFAQTVEQLGKQVRVSGRREDAAVLKTVAGKAFDDTPQPILGGFIAETADGARRLNLSFDELLRLREDQVRTVLSAA
jgi:vacuolar-type H+-ATPase subunit E/Vma4